jgi:hypothetical protein
VIRSKEEIRNNIAKGFEKHRGKLGDRFDTLVNEITDVRYEYLQKRDALPQAKPGVLDANAAAERSIRREEVLKIVLIKQKYGL